MTKPHESLPCHINSLPFIFPYVITDPVDVSLSKLQEIVKDRETWCAAVMGSRRVKHDLATQQQQAGFDVLRIGLKPPASGFQSYFYSSLKTSASPFEENGLLFWVPDVLCWHSEVVFSNLLSVQMFF